jgi:hypothetical protein
MKSLFLTALFTVVCLSIQARAYIPSSQFIFDRVSSLHGKGAYKITMDLAISLENEVQNIKETWLVVDGGEMYLHAQGDGFRTARLLKRGRIFWIDQDGSERSSESGPEFFMSYLLIRSPLDLKRALVKNGYLTPDI